VTAALALTTFLINPWVMAVNNLDAAQNAPERLETGIGLNRTPTESPVNMASPETRAIFQTNGEQPRNVMSDSGQLSFDMTDIYGGADKGVGGGLAASFRSRDGFEAAPTDAAGPAAATSDATSPTTTTADAAVPPTAAATDTAIPAAAAADAASPTAAAPIESTGAQLSAGTDAASLSAATANLTPEQAAIAQSTVQLTTPVVNVGPNGELSEGRELGTGFLFTGADGQQYIGTAGHVVAATGQDNLDGRTSYAEGPTQVTLPDGTQTTATVVANNTSVTSDNAVENGPPADVAVLSMAYPGPTLPSPSLQLEPNASLTPGETLNSVGYGNGQFGAMSSSYLGITTPRDVSTNSQSTTPMLAMDGSSVHGMSGSAVAAPDGGVVGIYSAGSSPTDGSAGMTLDTPVSTLSTLSQGLNSFDPNFLYNMVNSRPQPIATPYDRGNGSDQSLSGVTLSDGTTLDQPAGVTPAAPTDTQAVATPASPTDAPATATPAAPTDAPAAAPPAPTTADNIDASAAAAVTGLDASSADTSALSAGNLTAADSAAISASLSDMSFMQDFDMGDV